MRPSCRFRSAPTWNSIARRSHPMETARGGRIYFAFILIQITRQVRQHFIAHVRSISDVLAEQAFRIALGGKRRTEDSKMADRADDLGIPMKPAHPLPVPPRVADLSRPGGGPARAPASLNQRIDQSVDS